MCFISFESRDSSIESKRYTHTNVAYPTQSWAGIVSLTKDHPCGWKNTHESSKLLFLGNLIPEIESRAPNYSSDITFKWVGPQPHRGAFFYWSHFIHDILDGWSLVSATNPQPPILGSRLINIHVYIWVCRSMVMCIVILSLCCWWWC